MVATTGVAGWWLHVPFPQSMGACLTEILICGAQFDLVVTQVPWWQPPFLWNSPVRPWHSRI
jgi:hypothetical protein